MNIPKNKHEHIDHLNQLIRNFQKEIDKTVTKVENKTKEYFNDYNRRGRIPFIHFWRKFISRNPINVSNPEKEIEYISTQIKDFAEFDRDWEFGFFARPKVLTWKLYNSEFLDFLSFNHTLIHGFKVKIKDARKSIKKLENSSLASNYYFTIDYNLGNEFTDDYEL